MDVLFHQSDHIFFIWYKVWKGDPCLNYILKVIDDAGLQNYTTLDIKHCVFVFFMLLKRERAEIMALRQQGN